jgi:hypothetical protein
LELSWDSQLLKRNNDLLVSGRKTVEGQVFKPDVNITGGSRAVTRVKKETERARELEKVVWGLKKESVCEE